MTTPVAVAALAAALAGCAVNLDDKHQCDTTADCFDGRTCVGNRCFSTSAEDVPSRGKPALATSSAVGRAG